MTAVTDTPTLPRYSARTMDRSKQELEPLGSLYGLRCLGCQRVFYCNSEKGLHENFDEHDCENGLRSRKFPPRSATSRDSR